MKAGELFAGYGGLALAVHEVFGADTAWVAEFDPAPSKVLAARFPGVPNLGDVTAVDWSAVEPVDIIAGGYPCQPFSQAGRRQGQTDERHLWPYVVEALDVMHPMFGIFENVRGHLTLGFDDVMRDLDLLGYDAQWRVNRAADVGAPHGRARIFIFAIRRQSCTTMQLA